MQSIYLKGLFIPQVLQSIQSDVERIAEQISREGVSSGNRL